VPGFAPSVRSGRSEGIFVRAAAFANPLKPDFLTNHHGSSESRLLTPARRPIGCATAKFYRWRWEMALRGRRSCSSGHSY
jgi:hypothetical protein